MEREEKKQKIEAVKKRKKERIKQKTKISTIAAAFMLAVLIVGMICVLTFLIIDKPGETSDTKLADNQTVTEKVTDKTQITEIETTTAIDETTTAEEPAKQTLEPVKYKDVSGQVSVAFSEKIAAKSAILIDVNSKSVVYSLNAANKQSPASTTKLMTALVALQYLKPDDTIIAGNEILLIAPDSSTAQLRVGDRLKVKQVLQGMLLSSGNDAAYVLAVNAGRAATNNQKLPIKQAVSKFVELMNDNVKTMNLKDTVFESPDGYDTSGQYTTAYDLSQIAYEALQNDTIMNAISKHSVYVQSLGITWESTNELTNPNSEYYYDKAIGMKTGSTVEAGKCLVSVAKDGKQKYICVVLGDDSVGRWTDSTALLNYGFTLK